MKLNKICERLTSWSFKCWPLKSGYARLIYHILVHICPRMGSLTHLEVLGHCPSSSSHDVDWGWVRAPLYRLQHWNTDQLGPLNVRSWVQASERAVCRIVHTDCCPLCRKPSTLKWSSRGGQNRLNLQSSWMHRGREEVKEVGDKIWIRMIPLRVPT